MGVVLKQTIKGSILTYIGAFLGFITAAIVQPKVITPEQIGLLSLLNELSLVLGAFAALGFGSTIRYFPYFRNPKRRHHGYLFLACTIALVGFLLMCLFIFLFKEQIISQKSQDSLLFASYYYYLIPLTFFFLYFNVFELIARVNYEIVFSQFLREVLKRIFILIAFSLLFFNVLGFSGFMPVWLIASILPTAILFWSVSRKESFSFRPDFKFLKQNKDLVRKLINISSFTLLISIAPYIISLIDKYMINQAYGLSMTGVYTITMYFGAFISMPMRSLSSISLPVVAEAWKNEDRNTICSLYQKSCINQLIVAMLLFVGIWANVDNIFSYLPDFEVGKYVIFYIGLMSVVEMGTGINGTIIATSRYYRYDGLFHLLLVVFTIFTNLIFIPLYGIVGAALATALTKILFNLFRYFFVWRVFKMQAFSWRNLVAVLLGVVAYFASTLIPQSPSFIIDIIIRSVAITAIFLPAVYLLRLSEDINSLINRWFLSKLLPKK